MKSCWHQSLSLLFLAILLTWPAHTLAAEPGTLKWSYQTGDSIRSSPAIGSDGTIYVGSYDNNLYAINSNGSLKWSYETGNDIASNSPSIADDGTIYTASQDAHTMYAVNPNESFYLKTYDNYNDNETTYKKNGISPKFEPLTGDFDFVMKFDLLPLSNSFGHGPHFLLYKNDGGESTHGDSLLDIIYDNESNDSFTLVNKLGGNKISTPKAATNTWYKFILKFSQAEKN